MDTITLNCLVEKEDPYENCFEVEIDKARTISALKELIKDKQKPNFDHLPANQLKLWKVNVSLLESNDKLTVLVEKEPAMIEQKLEGERLLAPNDMQDYFSEQPAKKFIHIIVENPPSDREQELLKEIISLKTLFNKSTHDFKILVSPKWKNGFKWTVDIDHATLESLKKTIYEIEKSPILENNGAILDFKVKNGSDGNDERYAPRSDQTFREMLRQFVSKKNFKFTVFIGNPSKPLSEWEFPDVCRLYGLCESGDNPSFSVFPSFTCGFKDLKDESSQAILKHLIAELKARLESAPIYVNEASKSHYVFSYLLSGANFYKGMYEIRSEKNITGPNGHGPVDFAIDLLRTSKTAGVTEVKQKDFHKGIAQNVVQIESALSNRKRKADEMEEERFVNKVFGIVTDAEKWYFLKCSYDDQERPKFKLSNSIAVAYDNQNMESMVERVLGHIVWLLEEVQKPEEDLQSRGQSNTKRRKSKSSESE
ncbi:hypothetical protein Glove_303g133 [Diversispora epigaea]|uniref:Crinkler effector protein N-terminal domain-containing protein n=1 Tax=Diversispora epigaea TaxID=1348612 RepID=A0A397HYF8_9GLOM|nr:hypothetical protein Glove_303g133 [Diversispora epigaea]